MKKIIILLAAFLCKQAGAQIINKDIAGALQPLNNCAGNLGAVSAVSLGKERRTSVVFNHNGGTFDPAPLLSTSINVKENSCVIVHFSANTFIADNSVVYQVRMDGKPMEGHITGVIPAMNNSAQPIVMEGDEDGPATKTYRMSSFSFFSKAGAGSHKIEVFVAVCCSANTNVSPVVLTDNATLIVQYNKN